MESLNRQALLEIERLYWPLMVLFYIIVSCGAPLWLTSTLVAIEVIGLLICLTAALVQRLRMLICLFSFEIICLGANAYIWYAMSQAHFNLLSYLMHIR